MTTIRTATRGDIPAIDALLAESYPELLRADYPASLLLTALPLIARAQPALLTSGTYFVALADDGIVGAGGWTREAPPGAAGVPGTAHIRHVVTDHRRVRQGIGRALMNHVTETARAAGIRRLDCLSSRMAVPFYSAMGFDIQGPFEVALARGMTFPVMRMTRDIAA